MSKLIVAILLFLSLLACAHRGYWTKNEFDPLQFKRDSFECERDATIIAQGSGWRRGSILFNDEVNNARRRCLDARGYQWIRIK